jgi:4'-phosphopantetheinyl transferase
MLNSWNSVRALPRLQTDEVQLWRIDLQETTSLLEPYSSLLNDKERAKSLRYRTGRPQEHFAIGRACLRALLGANLEADPRTITIASGPHGKPEAAPVGGNNISFNVAHSKDKILIALSREGSIGVDVEHIDPSTDIMEVAQANFTGKEVATLSALSDSDARLRTFYTYWTRKEAFAKAEGRGLLLPLSSFEIAFDSMHHHPVEVDDATGNGKKRFFLSDLDLGDEAAGALALPSPNLRITSLIFPLSPRPPVRLQ